MILHGIEYQRPTSLNMRIMADHVTYSFLAFMKSIFHFCLGCYCGGYSQNGRSNLSSFYTPVWKTGRIMPWQCPSVRLSVRLSVRPSVRPRFPDFSSTCFEISIWNLVYAFSRWHDMSSLSCITIGSIWPSLQPKVGQTYFLQSWPHKSR